MQPGIWVGDAGMAFIGALLNMEIPLLVAPAGAIVIIAPINIVLRPERLHRSSGINQRALNAEVILAQQAGSLGEQSRAGPEVKIRRNIS